MCGVSVKPGFITDQPATSASLAAVLAVVIMYMLFMRVPAALYTYNIGIGVIVNGNGVMVDEVHPASPADMAGIMNGDSLVAIDGKSAQDWLTLYRENRSTYLAERHQWLGSSRKHISSKHNPNCLTPHCLQN